MTTTRNLIAVFFIQCCTSFSLLSPSARNQPFGYISGTEFQRASYVILAQAACTAVNHGFCKCRTTMCWKTTLQMSKEGSEITSQNTRNKETQRKLESTSKRPVYDQKMKSNQNLNTPKYLDTSVLKNLMAFDSLATLLDALELFTDETREGVVTAQQAVAALNHLKRLSKQANRAETSRAELCMRWYATVASNGMQRLSGKHVALVLNAIREYVFVDKNGRLESIDSSYVSLFCASIHRLKQLALLFKSGTEMNGNYLLDSQNIANIINALSTVRYQDRDLYKILSEATLLIPISDFGPQAVANILNGFARVEMWDEKLLDHLSHAAISMETSSFSAQHVANILNAFHKAGVYHLVLFQHMSAAAQILPASSYSVQTYPHMLLTLVFGIYGVGQAVANILSAFSNSGFRDESLFNHMAVVVQKLQDQANAQQPTTSTDLLQRAGPSTGGNGVRKRYVQSVQTFGAQALSMIVQVQST